MFSKSIIYLISRLMFTKIYTVLEIVVYDIIAKTELNQKNRLGVTTKQSIFTYTLLTHYLHSRHYLHSPTHTYKSLLHLKMIKTFLKLCVWNIKVQKFSIARELMQVILLSNSKQLTYGMRN